jgi:hypothetical protein
MAILDRFRARRDARTRRDYSRGPRTDETHAEHETRRSYSPGDGRAAAPAATASEVRAHQRDEYGGLNWGAAFFGWLVAIGIGVILTALLGAAGAALAISEEAGVETLGIGGAIGLVVIALLAYFTGGYVAGRMSRFDGTRQGFGVWAWFLIVAVILAIIGAIAGTEYNVFGGLDLPRIPIDEGDLTTGGVITLVAIALGTLLAAMAGGKVGESYHRRVDRVGFERAGDHARDARPVTRDRPIADRDGERVRR